MVVRTFGVDLLTLLMSLDRPAECDLSWMLYGPSDELVVEREFTPDADEPLRWAAE
jgi:hypothetical protein